MGRDLSSLTNKSLVSLMKSASFGTVQSDDGRGLKKSALFAGLAKIKAHFDPETQKANRQTREDFANALIQEFGLSRTGSAAKSLRELHDGENSGKPLTIKTAQKLIGLFLSRREGNTPSETPSDIKFASEMEKKFTGEFHEQLSVERSEFERTAHLVDEKIGRENLGSLRHDLVKLQQQHGEAGREEMIDAARQWLRLADRQDSREAAMSLLDQLGF